MNFRLLPIAVVAATALLGVKLTNLWQGVDALMASPSYAQSAAPTQGEQAQPAQADEVPATARTAAATANGSLDDPMLMTQSEIDLLQRLSQRRGELESWSNDLAMREQLLKAAEQRIETKVAELKAVQDSIKSLLKQHDNEQEAKLKSLVKIYETMKPKDAAPIFEQLEMPILLDVIERMKETKAAPVIAAMNPEKARKLTTELAKRRRLNPDGTERASGEQASNN